MQFRVFCGTVGGLLFILLAFAAYGGEGNASSGQWATWTAPRSISKAGHHSKRPGKALRGTQIPKAATVPCRLRNSTQVAQLFHTSGHISFIAGGDIYVVNAMGQNRQQITEGCNALTASWSPDGKKLIYVLHKGSHNAFILLTSATQAALADNVDYQRFGEIAWAPDSRRFAYWGVARGSHTGIKILDVTRRTGYIMAEVAQPPMGFGPALASQIDYLSWSPDGRVLLANDLISQQVRLFTVATGSVRVLPFKGYSFRLAPDGKNVAGLTLDQPRVVWAALDGSQSHSLRLTGRPMGAILSLSWSPDSIHLAIDVATGLTIVAIDSQAVRQIAIAQGTFEPHWSPDGKSILFWLLHPGGTSPITGEPAPPGITGLAVIQGATSSVARVPVALTSGLQPDRWGFFPQWQPRGR